jgi:hypothetical protein
MAANRGATARTSEKGRYGPSERGVLEPDAPHGRPSGAEGDREAALSPGYPTVERLLSRAPVFASPAPVLGKEVVPPQQTQHR